MIQQAKSTTFDAAAVDFSTESGALVINGTEVQIDSDLKPEQSTSSCFIDISYNNSHPTYLNTQQMAFSYILHLPPKAHKGAALLRVKERAWNSLQIARPPANTF